MSSDYVVWMHGIEPDACDLLEFNGFKRSYRLKRGMPLAEDWPDDVEMVMNEDTPDNTLLVDSLFNVKSLLVISERVRDFLQSRQIDGVEFLPLNIRNHKGRLIDESYFIVNITEAVDALDASASQAEESSMTDKIVAVKGIVLSPDAALSGRELVRLKRFSDPTLVSTSLADAIQAEGFSGIKWGELKDFTDKTW